METNAKKTLAYTSIIPKDSEEISNRRSLVLLHGYGSLMGDLAGLAPMIGNNNHYFCLNAPIELSFGYIPGSYSWFDTDEKNLETITNSVTLIKSTLDLIMQKHEIPYSEMVIGGFSQGGMVATHIGLTQKINFKGVISMSSRLLQDDMQITNQAPVFISHGTNDQVISVEEGRKSREILEKLKCNVSYKEYGMAHEIRQETINDLKEWLRKI